MIADVPRTEADSTPAPDHESATQVSISPGAETAFAASAETADVFHEAKASEYTVEDICRFYGVDPLLVSVGTKSIDRVRASSTPWTVRKTKP